MPHSHGPCEHEANGIDPLEMGLQYSLYQKIDMINLEVLNEAIEGSGKKIFKPYEERLNFESGSVESDCDQELLFNIPFTGNIKLKGIRVIGGNDGSHPKQVKLFKNRPKMTFDDVSNADQVFELEKDLTGSIEYNTQVVKFHSVHHLSLYFPTNFGEEITRIFYIGLRGEFSDAHHHGVTICTYETTPNISDHKTSQFEKINQHIH